MTKLKRIVLWVLFSVVAFSAVLLVSAWPLRLLHEYWNHEFEYIDSMFDEKAKLHVVLVNEIASSVYGPNRHDVFMFEEIPFDATDSKRLNVPFLKYTYDSGVLGLRDVRLSYNGSCYVLTGSMHRELDGRMWTWRDGDREICFLMLMRLSWD